MGLQIRHKLFLVILLANLVLAAALFVSVSWNFSRSFQDYIRADQAEELTPLVEALAITFRDHGGQWGWAARNHPQWQQLIRQYLDRHQPGLAPGQPSARPGVRRPPPPPHRTALARRLLLRDAGGELILGLPSQVSLPGKHEIQWIPILLDGERIGDLGVAHKAELPRELDRVFVQHLTQQSAWIAAGVLVLSGCLAFPFSRRLVRPIARLQQSMQQLAGGHFEDVTPLPEDRTDELGKLAQGFNLLARTLRENLHARQQWVADISHELRTPVAILQGELEALIDGIRPMDRAALDSLHAEVGRLSRLINDLYELSMSDQGALTYQREELSFTALIQDFLENSRSSLDDHDLQLAFQASEQPFVVFADETRLEQLLRNLLSNTLRYTSAPGQLRVSLIHDKAARSVVMQWEDSGPGVADEDLQRLFERLYRTDRARDRVSGGFGLGLAICRSIVEAHQGHIEASHSSLGGLAIRVRLPLYR